MATAGSPATGTDRLGLTALVLGIVSVPAAFFFPPAAVLGVVALVLGIRALRRIRRGSPGNRRLAVWALVTGGFGTFIGLAILDLVGQALNHTL